MCRDIKYSTALRLAQGPAPTTYQSNYSQRQPLNLPLVARYLGKDFAKRAGFVRQMQPQDAYRRIRAARDQAQLLRRLGFAFGFGWEWRLYPC